MVQGTVSASTPPPGIAPRCFLVLPAAGSGERMQSQLPKQYLQVCGKPVLQHTLERLATLECFSAVVLVLAPEDIRGPAMLSQLDTLLREKVRVVSGGAARFQSVLNALQALQGTAAADDWILVHDAVRPCVQVEDVRRLIDILRSEPAGGLLATPVRETLKEADAAGLVQRTVDRSRLWQAATPQMFRFAVLQQALELAAARNHVVTDEAAAVEALGLPVRLVPGRADNIKVTWPEDLAMVAALLQTAPTTQPR